MIEEERAARFKDDMTCAAFVGWQMGRFQGSISEHTTFPKYLKTCGLLDGPPPMTEEERAAMVAKAMEKASKIRAAFQPERVNE